MFVSKCFILLPLSACVCLIVISCNQFIYNSIKFDWDSQTITVQRSKIFDMYLKKFNKSYEGEEYQKRLKFFRDSMKEISILNGVTGAKHGWTQFTDMSHEELSLMTLQPRSDDNCVDVHDPCVPNVNRTIIPTDIPDKVDWRTKGAIGPVLDQLRCSCCWAISIVGNMEAMAVIRGLGYQQLSVQELMDCSTYNGKCRGGDMRALDFLCLKNFALTTEDQYPLNQDKDVLDEIIILSIQWSIEHRWPVYRFFSGVDYIFSTSFSAMDEEYMLRIIAHYGPVVVIVNATPLFNYIGGIIQKSCFHSHDDQSANHMVQIVGYDLSGSVPYYIVKNSWGTLYGEDGYVKIVTYKNMCGVADQVAYFDVY